MLLDTSIQLEFKSGDTPTMGWKTEIPNPTYRANIQPAGAEASIIADGEFGKTYIAFVETSNPVQVGWRVRNGARSFVVRGVEDFNSSILPHLRLTMVKE